MAPSFSLYIYSLLPSNIFNSFNNFKFCLYFCQIDIIVYFQQFGIIWYYSVKLCHSLQSASEENKVTPAKSLINCKKIYNILSVRKSILLLSPMCSLDKHTKNYVFHEHYYMTDCSNTYDQ